ncbi:MAG TPA: hypothetical protein VGN26_13990 [Armatimonadota bacterium]|jgi:hypothetical protein
MNEAQRRERNTGKLRELYPPFADQIAKVISGLEKAGYRPRIQEAYRSPEQQRLNRERGVSRLSYGFHNVTGPGGKPESLAVDLYDDDRPMSPSISYLLRLSGIAWERGLGTGVLWGLSRRQRSLVRNAIESRDWGRDVRVGWDPQHIEPTGITPQQARQGSRPTFHQAEPVHGTEPAQATYTVLFGASSTPIQATMLKDHAWLPLRVWCDGTGQTLGWSGSETPILLGGRPYNGETRLLGEGRTYSPVQDLAAFCGLELRLDTPARCIHVRQSG